MTDLRSIGICPSLRGLRASVTSASEVAPTSPPINRCHQTAAILTGAFPLSGDFDLGKTRDAEDLVTDTLRTEEVGGRGVTFCHAADRVDVPVTGGAVAAKFRRTLNTVVPLRGTGAATEIRV